MARLRKVRAALRASATHTPSPGLHAPARWHVPTADTIDAHSNESTLRERDAACGRTRECHGGSCAYVCRRRAEATASAADPHRHARPCCQRSCHAARVERLHDTSLRSRALGLFLLSTRPMSCRISLSLRMSVRVRSRSRSGALTTLLVSLAYTHMIILSAMVTSASTAGPPRMKT